VDDSVVDKENAPGSWVLNKKNRRKFAGWSIMFTCIGNFLLSYAASSFLLPGLVHQQFIYLRLYLSLGFKTWAFFYNTQLHFMQTMITDSSDILYVVLVDCSFLSV
jgi:hypothetical protein